MNTELEALIKYYEEQQVILKASIKTNIETWDYEAAGYNAQALQKVNRELLILSRFNSTKQLNLKLLRERMEKIQAQEIDDSNARIKRAWLRRVANLQKQIDELNNKEAPFSEDQQNIDEALYQLLHSKINGFRMHLSKKANLYLDLFCSILHLQAM